MMVLAMCAHILFPATATRGQVELRKVHSVEVKQSVHDLCQSATITLPKNISELQQEQLRTLIKRGDEVKVYLGYDDALALEFDGFVERTGADIPVVIDLRDALWKLLQAPFNKSYREVYVPTLVNDLVGSAFMTQALEATVGPMRFVKTTKGAAFKALKDEFGLVTYVKGGTVYTGELYATDPIEVTYDEEVNIKSSELKYRVADDVKLKVTAESIQRNGEKLSVEVGDPDGEQRTLSYYGISSETQLKKLAELDMQKFRFDGYEGGFKVWGRPFCQYGDRVRLRSQRFPERNGDYLAEGVNVTFGPEGFQREIKLAQRWT